MILQNVTNFYLLHLYTFISVSFFLTRKNKELNFQLIYLKISFCSYFVNYELFMLVINFTEIISQKFSFSQGKSFLLTRKIEIVLQIQFFKLRIIYFMTF